MQVFGFAGWSGSGKTTLVERLIPLFIARGLSISTVKHAHKGFDVDIPGKDSHRHRAAGAHEVLVVSPDRWVIMHEAAGSGDVPLASLLPRLAPVDLLLVEGFKRDPHPKIEVRSPDCDRPWLYGDDPSIVALAVDGSVSDRTSLPHFQRDDLAGITRFVLRTTGLG